MCAKRSLPHCVRPLLRDPALLAIAIHDKNEVSVGQKVQLMGDQNPGSLAKGPAQNAAMHEVVADFWVHG
jgi:hypothetical protein